MPVASSADIHSTFEYFEVKGRVAIITGGAGLLGEQHAAAIAGAGGIPVLIDIRGNEAERKAKLLAERYGVPVMGRAVDITKPAQIESLLKEVLDCHGRVDILINNAANNPKVDDMSDVKFSRFENFPIGQWEDDIAVGLTGSFYCCQIIGTAMARNRRGVILNIASDLSVISPDQRLYRQPNTPEDKQPVKPVTYSVVKTGLVGLTRYLATYWADAGVRVNAISFGGVFNNHPKEFVDVLSDRIPLGRMARIDEYRAAVLFLCSDASSYITGQNLVVDGGRSCW
jgi:NAD(P)-dependent dehydrogenase (short-subunit alcohol dehydrogenase family)